MSIVRLVSHDLSRTSLAVVCLLSTLALRADVTLVKDGKPAATIVIPADDWSAEFAAGQLRYWVREITGAEMPIVDSRLGRGEGAAPTMGRGEGAAPTKVFLGRALAERAFPEDAAWLGSSQGFAVREKGGDLYVFGGIAAGALFGCYDILEQATDIIWPSREEGLDRLFTPTKDLVVKKVNYREKPTIARRVFNPENPRDDYHFLRNRVTPGGFKSALRRFGFDLCDSACHNTLLYLPWSEFGKDHPEYYAERNGKRLEQHGGFDGNACWSSMEGAEAYARTFVRDRIDGGVPCYQYGIGAEDNNLICECKACQAPIKLPDGRILKLEDDEELFRSTKFLLWISHIAETIEKLRPGTQIETLAYMYATRPPAITLPKNVVVKYAPISKNMKQTYFGKTNARAKLFLDQWSERCRELNFYEYWGDGSVFPRPITKILEVDLPYMVKRKASSVFCEWGTRDAAPFVSAMEFWVVCRMMWNTARPLEELREEYMRKTYRAAAPEMRVFYDTLRDAWYKDSSPSYYYDNPVGLTGYYFLGDEKLGATCFNALSNACAKADHPVSKQLIGKIKEIMENYLAQARKTFVKGGSSSIPMVTSGGNLRAIEGSDWGQALVLRADRELPAMFKLVKPLTVPVEARVAHDGKNLYVKYHAGWNPAVFKEKAAKEKSMWSNEHWELFLQTSRDDPAVPYYMLAIDPMGKQVTMSGTNPMENPPKWTAEVRRSGDTWDAVCVFPFDAFGITKDFAPRIHFMHHAQKSVEKCEWASWKGFGVHNVSAFTECTLEGLK